MKLFRIILFTLFILNSVVVMATHNRAGEITYKWVGVNAADLTYEITIITYTRTSSYPNVDRPQLDSVHLGDGSVVSFQRTTSAPVSLGNDISYNEYKYVHTYSGNGVFRIYFVDPNRNEGVVNIPNSVDVPFAVESELVINPYLGPNSSPVLTYPPIDKGCVGRVFIHNPNAYDAEGDSLVYLMEVCNGDGNLPIPGYTFPTTSSTFGIDLHTGDLIWDSPIDTGEYNVAFIVKQYKQGQYAGFVRRDMQILISNCTNNPPDLEVVSDTCVLAGDTLSITVDAIDPDHNLVNLFAYGAMFDTAIMSNLATFTPTIINNDTVQSVFKWTPICSQVRNSPYVALFKAVDVIPPSSNNIPLVSLKSTSIRVIAPAVQSVTATANGNGIDLTWTISPCGNAIGYLVYRRENIYTGTIQCPCDNGAPSYTGYQLLERVNGVNTLSYRDDNHGSGLAIGKQYCYIVTAIFSDGSESCASPQACASLIKDLPVITNVDVTETDAVNGKIYVAWSKPNELDTNIYRPPFEYRVFRSPDFFGTNFTQFAVLNDLNDTTIIDQPIDTKTHPWSYRVDLYYTDNGNLVLKGNSTIASGVFLKLSPTDNRINLTWEEHVPWSNDHYDIFKLNNVTSVYDSITTVTTSSYADTGLVNGDTYCYYVRSRGAYSLPGIITPLLNRSQQECSVPVDNVPPCATELDVQSDCDANANFLQWVNPNHVCSDDVLKYYICFSPSTDGNFELIDSVLNPADTTYLHSNLSVISGCYKVVAIDSVGNQTLNPQVVCVDTCRQYVLPSVFTPNSDGVNDLFHPCDASTSPELQAKNCPPYKNVKSVEMKIFNRWGNLVYETTDKDIKWDGKNKDSKADCPEGVYYYTCKVYFFRISGDEAVELHGTIQLIRGGK